MHKGRLEAFSDGVFAIIITIMVLELKPPHGNTFAELCKESPVFLAYILSFIYVGIYWNNHHHMFQAARRVSGGVMWANLHLLFWLSLTPFGTNWLGRSGLEPMPVAVYGFVLFMSGIAYYILAQLLIRVHDNDSPLARAIGSDVKGKISVAIYAIAIPWAFFQPAAACMCYVAVAIMWLIPDRRIERELVED